MNTLSIEEFYFLNSLYNGKLGRAANLADIEKERALKDANVLNSLWDKGLVNKSDNTLTDDGLMALEPYKVSNAVILAAGASTRFIPLSLEQPKGLYEVKGEKLIERQINQLIEAGIKDITLVLGYKKEMFYYLKERYGVKFIINDTFNIKNNIESLYLAKNELKNTYVCVSDSYFVENPFNQYEYRTFCTGITLNESSNEMYVEMDSDSRIIKMLEGQSGGTVLLGHSFWQKEFSDEFIKMAIKDREVGKYNNSFWEWMVKDNLMTLPAIYFKEYKSDSIFEFDYFEDLRKFDTQYLSYTHSEIIRNIKLVFRCDEEDIVDFRNVSEGLTNTSFIFKINGVDYIYRHPGDGTDKIINRRHEKTSLVKAKEINIDPTYIYMDVNEGWKISRYIKEFREPDYNDFEDAKKIIGVLKNLHASGVKVDYGMKPWEDSIAMEELLLKKDPDCFKEYEGLKKKIGKIYGKTVGDGIERCFCHGDTYKPNWMIQPNDEVILIDWEYSGYQDPGIDVGYYIVDAMYDFDMANKFIDEYLGDDIDDVKKYHFMAYVAIIAYYWFVWALYRESCGACIGEALTNWKNMAIKYADYLCD